MQNAGQTGRSSQVNGLAEQDRRVFALAVHLMNKHIQ
jgi:hypothetical protein